MKYLTPQQHLRRLYFERFKTWLKYVGISFMGAVAIGILYTCLTSDNDTQKMNECLQKHDLDYCNKVVR
jgi:hypothetical protein